MKKILIILSALILTACKNENANQIQAIENSVSVLDKSESSNFPMMSFEEREHDFGFIQQGDEVSTVFKFTNTGNAPLKISDIKAKCGCTVPNWSKETIAPNGKGEFRVNFNSRGKQNRIRQVITITSNTKEATETVTITAYVKVL